MTIAAASALLPATDERYSGRADDSRGDRGQLPAAGRTASHRFGLRLISRGGSHRRQRQLPTTALYENSRHVLVKLVFDKKGSSIMLQLSNKPHNGRAKDGSISAADGMATMGRLAGRRIAWSKPVAAVVDHYRHPVCLRPTDRYNVAPSGGYPGRLCRILLLPAALGTQGQTSRGKVVDAAADAARDRQACAVCNRRLAYQALRPASARSWHSPQSHTGPGRPEVSVWPYLGDNFLGDSPSALAYHRAAVVGTDVCTRERHCQHPAQIQMEVPYEAAAGGEADAQIRGNGQSRGENSLGRRRWSICPMDRSSNHCEKTA